MVPTEGLARRTEAAASGGCAWCRAGVDTRLFDPARRSEALRAGWGAGRRDAGGDVRGAAWRRRRTWTPAGQACEAMRRPRPAPARLVLVGDGPERRALQQRCPSAVFAGVRAAKTWPHYASADLFLFPSLTETFGNVVPEAMASGLAVVAYDYAAAQAGGAPRRQRPGRRCPRPRALQVGGAVQRQPSTSMAQRSTANCSTAAAPQKSVVTAIDRPPSGRATGSGFRARTTHSAQRVHRATGVARAAVGDAQVQHGGQAVAGQQQHQRRQRRPSGPRPCPGCATQGLTSKPPSAVPSQHRTDRGHLDPAIGGHQLARPTSSVTRPYLAGA
jgi:hypothetical protein